LNKILVQQQKDEKRRREDKVKDLKEFIQRFASNASKSGKPPPEKKSSTSPADDIVPLSRRFPYVSFKPNRDIGNNVLKLVKLGIEVEGAGIRDFSLNINRNDKIAFVGREHVLKSALFSTLAEETKPEAGDIYWGQTVERAYFPKDSTALFDSDLASWTG
jgi:ATPase subunit of ABC transporter with duplicated ATPase domains